MLKKVLLLVLLIILGFEIFVFSNFAIEITIPLAIFLLSFFIPYFRSTIFTNRMRKIRVALYTTLIFTIGLSLLILPSFFREQLYSGDLMTFIFVVIVFSLVGNICYGLPVTVLAEYISSKTSQRLLVNGSVHLLFGLAVFLVLPRFAVFAVVCSLLFFIIDELTMRKIKT